MNETCSETEQPFENLLGAPIRVNTTVHIPYTALSIQKKRPKIVKLNHIIVQQL